MIEIVEGKGVGAGKSYYVATRIISFLASGGSVWASATFGLDLDETRKLIRDRYGVEIEDDQWHVFPQDQISTLHEVTPIGTADCPILIVIDEAQGELNARDWADKHKRAFFLWLTQSRHDDCDLIFISQSALNIDKQIARLATYIIRVRNMSNFSFPGLGKWPFKQFVVGRYDQDGKTFLGPRLWLWHDKGIFKCYSSKVMRGAHKRFSSTAVPRKKLQKTKPKSRMFKVIILVVLLLCGFVGYRFYVYQNPPEQVVAIVPGEKSKSSASPSLGNSLPAVSVRAEVFRGQSGDEFLITDRGFYCVGKLCADGFVKSIGDHMALIITPDHRSIYVLGELDRSPAAPAVRTAQPYGSGLTLGTPITPPSGIAPMADLTGVAGGASAPPPTPKMSPTGPPSKPVFQSSPILPRSINAVKKS